MASIGNIRGDDRDAAALARRRFFAEMPKAELHLHLDGGLRISTALDLARSRGVAAPASFEAMSDALTAGSAARTQDGLLAGFDLPVALLQDHEALERVAGELVEDRSAERVRYLEMRFAPRLHQAQGLTSAAVVRAIAVGAGAAADRLGVTVRLIAVAVRSHEPADNAALARELAAVAEPSLVGWDLAGSETAYPDPLIHRAAFDVARAAGLRITLHSGEIAGGAALLWRALELDPDRIAHGPRAIDDPRLCAELAARRIPLDLCPTSNVDAGSVARLEDHPIPELLRRGVLVTVSTDDPTLSAVSLTDELESLVTRMGLSQTDAWRLNVGALDHAFAAPDVIAPLRVEFAAWAAGAGASDASESDNHEP